MLGSLTDRQLLKAWCLTADKGKFCAADAVGCLIAVEGLASNCGQE